MRSDTHEDFLQNSEFFGGKGASFFEEKGVIVM